MAHNTDHSLELLQQQESDLRNKLFNLDGYGLAWYTNVREEFGEALGPRPCVYKTIQVRFFDYCDHFQKKILKFLKSHQ